ncbi:MAG: hypothetical protein R3B68_07615 [Phycisphaerales bacterium]
MLDLSNISWRAGWGFVLAAVALLVGFWAAFEPGGMAWAWWGYAVTASVVSVAALVVVLSAWLDAGGGSEREFWALSEWLALVGDTPWWGKALVVLGGVAWVVV